jgi:two-component system sensor histidine kinase EvgS
MATILIVDDESTVRCLLSIALSERHTVLEAANGEEAVKLFEQHHPNIIITDLSMPGMSGLELTRIIRTVSSEVKIIIHSSSISEPETRAICFSTGVDWLLPKPADLSTIEKAISELLSGE